MVLIPVPVTPALPTLRERRWRRFDVATRRAKRAWSKLQPPGLYRARKERSHG